MFAPFGAVAEPGAAANADGPQRLSNGSFQHGLKGWRGHRAQITVVRGRHGQAVRVALKRSQRHAHWFSIYRRPRLRTPGTSAQYSAGAWVRGERRGRQICLRVHELAGAAVVGQAAQCVRSTGKWQRFPRIVYRVSRAGTSIGISVSQLRAGRGNVFRVDAVTLRQVSAAPLPTSPTAPGSPQLGVQFHCAWDFYTDADRSAVLDKLQAAGVQWVRIDVSWSGIEWTARGDRNKWWIDRVDTCVDEARKRGISVLVTLWLTPAWANGGRGERVAPNDPGSYAEFARWAAEYWRGRVAAWEVWNEPNPSESYWNGTTEQYVSLLKAAYPAFKAGDPGALVVLGGPSYNDAAWIDRVYALGAKGSFDVLATHPYQGLADAPPDAADDGNKWWFTHLSTVRDVMIRYGDEATPVWFTEFGWSAHDDWPGVENWHRGVTPEQQADYLARAVEKTRTDYPYVDAMFWYKERAKPGSTDVHQEGFALLGPDLSERPVYRKLQELTG
jgi:hypothetical protein